jgi:hypothetical protein
MHSNKQLFHKDQEIKLYISLQSEWRINTSTLYLCIQTQTARAILGWWASQLELKQVDPFFLANASTNAKWGNRYK